MNLIWPEDPLITEEHENCSDFWIVLYSWKCNFMTTERWDIYNYTLMNKILRVSILLVSEKFTYNPSGVFALVAGNWLIPFQLLVLSCLPVNTHFRANNLFGFIIATICLLHITFSVETLWKKGLSQTSRKGIGKGEFRPRSEYTEITEMSSRRRENLYTCSLKYEEPMYDLDKYYVI
jgi:hypothetical protein